MGLKAKFDASRWRFLWLTYFLGYQFYGHTVWVLFSAKPFEVTWWPQPVFLAVVFFQFDRWWRRQAGEPCPTNWFDWEEPLWWENFWRFAVLFFCAVMTVLAFHLAKPSLFLLMLVAAWLIWLLTGDWLEGKRYLLLITKNTPQKIWRSHSSPSTVQTMARRARGEALPPLDSQWARLAAKKDGRHWRRQRGEEMVLRINGTNVNIRFEHRLASGDRNTFYMPVVGAPRFQARLFPQDKDSEVNILLGMQDIQVGDAGFDPLFVLQSSDPDTFARLLAIHSIKSVLWSHPAARMRIANNEVVLEIPGPVLCANDIEEILVAFGELQGELANSPGPKGLS